MKTIHNFEELRERLRQGEPCRVAAIEATDSHSSEAVETAVREGWAKVTNLTTGDPQRSADEAVQMVRNGEADVIMKGIINTDVLLRAVLNKEHGLLPKGNVLTHLSAIYLPMLGRIILMGDPAVIPYPTLEQREAMIRYTVKLAAAYGIEEPRIALIHCTEKVSEKFPLTLDYVQLIEKSKRGEFGKAIVDGPTDLKCAICKESADIKGIVSPLEGRADMLMMPDIEAGNVFYKTLTAFTDAQLAVGLMGAACPISLTSRSDSMETKLNSLAMACLQVRS
ncbi:MAG: phosphate butyryltransferase [Prevotella sp.]|jgi:phosphotransacetylase|nr:phosphate butyryltransferase [Prevotella sp.]MBR6139244.1 phosphate butyryltransferase [Prevotella sp.]